MTTRNFFRDLPAVATFSRATNSANHVDLPDDWWVIVADVADSTKAIGAGRYKEVNTIGAATIVAILNVDRSVEIPFIFGGDGATAAVPPDMEAGARRALLGAADLAATAFQMRLRVGMIQVGTLRAQGDWVRVAKLTISTHVSQTLLSGRGWETAEKLLKSDAANVEVKNRPEVTADASFEGLECRWLPVASRGHFKLNLLVLSTATGPDEHAAVYDAVMATFTKVFGEPADHHPLRSEALALTFDPRSLGREIAVRTQQRSWAHKLRYAAGLILMIAIGKIFFRLGINTKNVAWSRYRDDVVTHTDYKKFDGALKMVIDASTEQQAAFEAFLEDQFQKGKLVYGTHTSSHAILTCLVFSHKDRHSHFIDGADGGYAVAATKLKARLKEVLARRSAA